MMSNIICIYCDWVGDPGELLSKTEALDDLDFVHCPDCNEKDCFEDQDEHEDEDE